MHSILADFFLCRNRSPFLHPEEFDDMWT